MKITRNNYELFFIDYLDGKLSHSDELELMAFLALNPDLEEELNLVRGIKIEPEKISFFDKNSLKKSSIPELSNEQFDELCIGKIEKTLNKEEETLLAQYLELNPEKVKDLKLFEMTILKADSKITFGNKVSLKRIEISAERFNELSIAKIENEISKKEENILLAYISQNPSFEKELNLFGKTIATPDLSIQYPDKQSLKRKVIGVSYRKIVVRSISAAAAIVLLLVTYNYFNKADKHGNLPKMFATSLHPENYKKDQKQDVVVNNQNKNLAVNKTNVVKINNQTQIINIDTTQTFANNNPLNQDSVVKKNEIINTPVTNNGNYMASNQNYDNKQNKIDKTYDAIFAESRYSHFRDMIGNVPYDAIQPSASGLNNINLWDVVEEGSKGISAITGADVDFKKKTDNKHKTEKFSFHIGRFGFSKTVHK